jgi:hypothetical protein
MIRKLLDLIVRFFRWLGGLMLDCVSNNPQISIDVDTQNLNFSDLVRPTRTCQITSGSPTVDCADTSYISEGMPIKPCTQFPSGAKVSSIVTDTSITFDTNAADDGSDIDLVFIAVPCGNVEIIIQAGVTISSDDAPNPAIETGDLSGYTVKLVNKGSIYGAGGKGGNGRNNTSGAPGEDGGTAIKASSKIAVVNKNTIAGGGGGGGGGGDGDTESSAGAYGGSGGGGCGSSGGPGGTWYGTGGTATLTTPGTGHAGRADSLFANDYLGGTGGTGGMVGENGNDGGDGLRNGSFWNAGGAGGEAGYYIDGIANVQFQNNGTALGRVT